ncbi:MAG: RluA family pseudouridine synthase, partial [Armatimonadetes bacterium]|nr:RluA family pseudouridine synthase [Armatimonadota bacterium]
GWARPHILTRLDKAPSGVALIAKPPQAHRALQKALETRRIPRRYMALVRGLVTSDSGEISVPLAPDRAGTPRMVLDQHGKEAVTFYSVRRRFALSQAVFAPGGITLLHLSLHTGRTHQIRAHLTYLRHPVVGDYLYDPGPASIAQPPLQELIEKLGGIALHAREVRFPDPITGQMRGVTVPPPEPFLDLLRWLHREQW